MATKKKYVPAVHICSFVSVADVKRGRYRFDFSDRFGPLFVRANGEPLKNQPQPGSAAWSAFESWYEEFKKSPTQ
jgi:hypothetical protein